MKSASASARTACASWSAAGACWPPSWWPWSPSVHPRGSPVGLNSMSSLIEQAAQRLAQIREAGIVLPGESPTHDGALPAPAPDARPVVPPKRAPPPTALCCHVQGGRDEPGPVWRAMANLVPSAPRTHMADQYRVIKRPLIANATGKGTARVHHGNLIMVTSAMPGEGKSFTAINLAMSIAAELDHTVMLVDADVARPSMLKKLGLGRGAGAAGRAGGQAAAQRRAAAHQRRQAHAAAQRPAPPQVDPNCWPATPCARCSTTWRRATRIAIIIFDSPPLLLTTESRVLASQMGQVVMVVHAGKTLQADVQHALSTIESCPIRFDAAEQGPHGWPRGVWLRLRPMAMATAMARTAPHPKGAAADAGGARP